MHFTLYTKAGCHLCDGAKQFLSDERRRWAFIFETVDIDTDPILREKYGDCVPVLVLDGKVRFRGRINPVLFRRLIKGRRRGGTP